MTSVKHVHKKYTPTFHSESDWKNIRVISIFAFADAFQFSFFVWTFWPYVQQVRYPLTDLIYKRNNKYLNRNYKFLCILHYFF
uniref:MFS transporter n=1 Tax=Heterorhabditis bacteriophora TaxID=37862 RepID=A0A1I7WVU2_HETBA